MSEQDINREWAWSHIEAWVDRSLTGASRARMHAVLQTDAELRAAVERAAAVRSALRDSVAAPLPKGLRRRLLAIPSLPARAPLRFALPAAVTAAAAIAAIAVWLAPSNAPPPDPRTAALADFQLAMYYLNKSARITQVEVTGAVGAGLRDAWTASRESIEKSTKDNGG